MDAIVLAAWPAAGRVRMVIRITAIEALLPRTLVAAGQFIPLAANEVAFIEGRLALFNVPAPV